MIAGAAATAACCACFGEESGHTGQQAVSPRGLRKWLSGATGSPLNRISAVSAAGAASRAGGVAEIILFYKYVDIDDVPALCAQQHSLCTRLGLSGRVLLGTEGVNGTLSGSPRAIREYVCTMKMHPLFTGIDWKSSVADPALGLPFPDLVVKQVKEIVSLGKNVDPQTGGKHIPPQQFHEALGAATSINSDSGAGGIVLLDVRNTFEYAVGHFENALEPKMKEFSAFPAFVDAHKEEWADKKVLMYCTGGIRCEKASAYMKSVGVSDVSQLAGGIHRYLEAYPDGGHFRGKNFVFDKRVTMPSGSDVVVGRCLTCRQPYDELSGARICTVCRDLVLICPACAASVREYHCAAHHKWAHCYFSFLESFTEEQLAQQAKDLNACAESLLSSGKTKAHAKTNRRGKSQRATLRKQLAKVSFSVRDEPPQLLLSFPGFAFSVRRSCPVRSVSV